MPQAVVSFSPSVSPPTLHKRNVMLKFLIPIVCAYILFKLLSGDKKKKEVRIHKEKQKMAEEGLMVKDPICGTYVSTDTDIRVKEGEKVHRFCSYECRDKFLKQIEDGKE
jgi:YHS domain-containing protein